MAIENQRVSKNESVTIRRRLRNAIAGVAAFALAACASTGGPLGLSRDQEKAIGEQQHPQILAQFGGEVEDAKLRAYVEGIAKRLIAAGDHPADPIVVTTLDSPVVNAFALPGHVYVTRGLLSLANSEAELAGVLGHELGHVYARHTARRVSRSNVTGIGAVIVGILTGSEQGMQLANQLGQVYLLKYSRGQEYESDLIGVRLLAKANYDPTAQADFLQTLGRWTDVEMRAAGQNSRPPEFLSTHPNSADRVRRAAAEAQAVAAAGAVSSERSRATYMSMINGMLYGDDPVKQGFIRNGNEFIHPGMGLAFTAPAEFKLANTPSAVVGRTQNGGQMQFSGGASNETPAAIIEGQISKSLGVNLAPARNFTVNGRSGAVGTARAQTQNGPLDVQAFVISWEGTTKYIFLWVTPANDTARLQRGVNDTIASLRKINPGSVQVPNADHINVVAVGARDTAASLAAKTTFPNAKEERFIVINGLLDASDIRVGQSVKLVR
ncbi:MAG: M48 family metalloprotease [Parvularculaceae bacterium]|nr:M48 family metalloprotease [Parvularculaceae bacterium]